MKALLITLITALLLSGCTTIQIGDDTIKSVRRIAYSNETTTVVVGQVLINDETVQVLAREAAAANK